MTVKDQRANAVISFFSQVDGIITPTTHAKLESSILMEMPDVRLAYNQWKQKKKTMTPEEMKLLFGSPQSAEPVDMDGLFETITNICNNNAEEKAVDLMREKFVNVASDQGEVLALVDQFVEEFAINKGRASKMDALLKKVYQHYN